MMLSTPLALSPRLTSAGIAAAMFLLSGCPGGAAEPADDAGAVGKASNDVSLAPGDTTVMLLGTVTFISVERNADSTSRQRMTYSRRFEANCTFRQPAVTWRNAETGTDEFRLVETEPGVLASDARGTGEATGDAVVQDPVSEPPLTQTSMVRLRGTVTHCLIRRLDPAQFGQGYDIELDFQVALNGTVRTTTVIRGASSVDPSGGLALPFVLAREPSPTDGSYSLVDDPANVGMHLHAAPLLLRPDLGPRPAGADPEVQTQQQIYDGLRTNPQTAWIGLRFDPAAQAWTFRGQHVTAGGADHSLQVRIEVMR